jgi:hypothetical protein
VGKCTKYGKYPHASYYINFLDNDGDTKEYEIEKMGTFNSR